MAASHNGKQAYRRLDDAYHLWWDIAGAWHISVLLGVDGVAFWERIDPNILGAYDPMGTATGTATVAIGSHL